MQTTHFLAPDISSSLAGKVSLIVAGQTVRWTRAVLHRMRDRWSSTHWGGLRLDGCLHHADYFDPWGVFRMAQVSLLRMSSGLHLEDAHSLGELECAVLRWWVPEDERAGRRRRIQNPLENAMEAGRVCARGARLGNEHVFWDGAPIWSTTLRRPPTAIPKLTAWQLSTAKRFMLLRLSNRLLIGDVATALALSRSYFVRSFTNTVGIAPYRWLVEQRINQARDLLTRTTIPLAQIALECGFADQSHFTNAFSRRVGTTPSKWRKGEGRTHRIVARDNQDTAYLRGTCSQR